MTRKDEREAAWTVNYSGKKTRDKERLRNKKKTLESEEREEIVMKRETNSRCGWQGKMKRSSLNSKLKWKGDEKRQRKTDKLIKKKIESEEREETVLQGDINGRCEWQRKMKEKQLEHWTLKWKGDEKRQGETDK